MDGSCKKSKLFLFRGSKVFCQLANLYFAIVIVKPVTVLNCDVVSFLASWKTLAKVRESHPRSRCLVLSRNILCTLRSAA